MTPIDPFERQLPVALTRLADPRTPDYLTDILGRTVRTRQRPAWRSLERWLPVLSLTSPRLIGLLAAAALAIALLGSALLGVGGGPAPGPSTPSPSTSPSLDPSAAASPTAAQLPGGLLGGWVAPSRGTAAEDPTVTFIQLGARFEGVATSLWVDRQGFNPILPAVATEQSPGVLRLEARDINGGCSVGDIGSYRWGTSDDGQWLTLDLVEDACAARSVILPGTWQRSLSHSNAGGPGMMASDRGLAAARAAAVRTRCQRRDRLCRIRRHPRPRFDRWAGAGPDRRADRRPRPGLHTGRRQRGLRPDDRWPGLPDGRRRGRRERPAVGRRSDPKSLPRLCP